jgi:phospholipase A1
MTRRRLRLPRVLALLALATTAGTAIAQEDAERCLRELLATAPDTSTLGELREDCGAERTKSGPNPRSMVGHRLALERRSHDNPFVLTAHRPNYVLPLTWVSLPAQANGTGNHDFELQFQLSQKVLLSEEAIAGHGDLYVAYTNRSYWQAYSTSRSAPFRETTHEPELILSFNSSWKAPGGIRLAGHHVILNHQSNGRSGDDSRSWNRIILSALFEMDNFVFALRPWWRIPESAKSTPESARGDDNPDIERYYGQMEVIGAWTRGNNLYSFTLRNNLRSDNRGAIELSWSFPVYRSIRATVRYFNGYGESLINYNRSTQALGVGFLIADWL